MCLAQGQNVVAPVRLEPAALRSRAKHSTTEPLNFQSLRAVEISCSVGLSGKKGCITLGLGDGNVRQIEHMQI